MVSFLDTVPAKVTRRRILDPRSGIAILLVLVLFDCGGPLPSADRVSFRTGDGFLLDGRLFGSGSKGVVLSHMFSSDQSSWYEFADELAKDGYLVITYDFRGYGKSEGNKDIAVIDRDVAAAVSYLTKEKGAAQVVLVGASMGGTASLVASSRLEVAGVATLSSPVEFMGLDAGGFVSNLPFPKIYIAARDDLAGAAEAAGSMIRSDPTAELRLLGGDAHGTDMLKGSRGEEVKRALREFIAKTI